MMNNENFLCMFEDLYTDTNLEVIVEEASSMKNKGGLKFLTTLQEAEVINSNHRRYKKNTLQEGIMDVTPKMKQGIFFGEMDHPKTDSPARFASVMLGNASHRITEMHWDGNLIKGVGYTLSNSIGKDMRALIEEDGIKLGFSLRALGEAKRLPDGSSEVGGKIKIITFDCVANPSHTNALIDKVITESDIRELLLDKSDRVKMIAESSGFDNLEILMESSNEDKLFYNPDTNLVQICTSNSCATFMLEEYITEKYKATLGKKKAKKTLLNNK